MAGSMQAKDLLIEPSQVWLGTRDSLPPLGFVDLQACAADVRLETLPPFPLIGLGDPAHPLAGGLDTVVESPVSAESLIRQAVRAPRAAAVAIQLLRSLQGLPLDRALPLQSFCYGLLQC